MCCPERVKQADITAVQMVLTLALHAVSHDNANFDGIFFRRVCVHANVCTCLCACVCVCMCTCIRSSIWPHMMALRLGGGIIRLVASKVARNFEYRAASKCLHVTGGVTSHLTGLPVLIIPMAGMGRCCFPYQRNRSAYSPRLPPPLPIP